MVVQTMEGSSQSTSSQSRRSGVADEYIVSGRGHNWYSCKDTSGHQCTVKVEVDCSR